MGHLFDGLRHMLEECEKAGGYESPPLCRQQCDQLESIVKEKLYALMEMGELHKYHCRQIGLLYLFRELMGEAQLHDYIGKVIKSDEGFATFLISLRSVGIKYPGGEYPCISSNDICNVTGWSKKCLEDRCQKILAISPSWLSETATGGVAIID